MDGTRRRSFDAPLFAAGAVLLIAGAMFYVIFRAEPVAFLQWAGVSPVDGIVRASDVGWLPSFAHAAAFTLLTAAWLERRAGYVMAAASGWFAINAAFEFLQLMPDPVVSVLPRLLANYAASGTFDARDIAGAAAGACTGAMICWTVARQAR